jgi:hypothetical protein
MFGIMFPDALFVKSLSVPLRYEKWYVDLSRLGRNVMHYVNHRSCRMQKHMFGVTCSNVLLCDLYWSHPSMKNSASTFHDPDPPECTT